MSFKNNSSEAEADVVLNNETYNRKEIMSVITRHINECTQAGGMFDEKGPQDLSSEECFTSLKSFVAQWLLFCSDWSAFLKDAGLGCLKGHFEVQPGQLVEIEEELRGYAIANGYEGALRKYQQAVRLLELMEDLEKKQKVETLLNPPGVEQTPILARSLELAAPAATHRNPFVRPVVEPVTQPSLVDGLRGPATQAVRKTSFGRLEAGGSELSRLSHFSVEEEGRGVRNEADEPITEAYLAVALQSLADQQHELNEATQCRYQEHQDITLRQLLRHVELKFDAIGERIEASVMAKIGTKFERTTMEGRAARSVSVQGTSVLNVEPTRSPPEVQRAELRGGACPSLLLDVEARNNTSSRSKSKKSQSRRSPSGEAEAGSDSSSDSSTKPVKLTGGVSDSSSESGSDKDKITAKSSSSSHHRSGRRNTFRPKLELMKFTGPDGGYFAAMNTLDVMVEGMDEREMMVMLRMACRGEARDAIANFDASRQGDYRRARRRLEERYGNKTRRAEVLWHELLSMEVKDKCTIIEAKTRCAAIEKLTLESRHLGASVNSISFISTMLAKMPPKVAKHLRRAGDWESARKLLKAMNFELRALERSVKPSHSSIVSVLATQVDEAEAQSDQFFRGSNQSSEAEDADEGAVSSSSSSF